MTARLARRPFTTIAVLVLGVSLVAAPSAFAGSAQSSLAVSANVLANCTITTSALSFGTYDPVSAHASTPLDNTGTVTVACTKGSSVTIGLDLGSNAAGTTRRMVGSGTGDFLTYELFKDSGYGSVWGNSGGDLLSPTPATNKNGRDFTVYGRIPASQDISVDTYADTVTATVNF